MVVPFTVAIAEVKRAGNASTTTAALSGALVAPAGTARAAGAAELSQPMTSQSTHTSATNEALNLE